MSTGMSTVKQVSIATWSILHSALHGYHITSLNGIQDAVVCTDQRASSMWMLNSCLDISDGAFGLAVTIFTIGGLIGSLSADAISRRFDRVKTLRIAETGFLIGAIAVGLSNEIWLMAAGRVLIGISSGLVMVAIPPYLAQISTGKYRIIFGTLHQIFIGLGMIVSQSLSLVLARPFWWRIELLVAASIAATLLITGLFVNEGVVNEGNESIGQGSEPNEETALLGEEEEELKEPLSVKDLLQTDDPSLRWGLLTVSVALFAQQICGISPVMYFSSRIFSSVFAGESKIVALFIIGIGIPFNFVPGLLPDSIGSRNLLIISAIGTASTSILLGIGLNIHNQILSGASVIAFVISFSIGLAPVAWVVLSEIMPPNTRTAAGSIAVSVNWMTNFLAGSLFLPLQQLLKDGDKGEGNIFFVFAGASTFAAASIWLSFRLYNNSRET